MCLKLGRQWKKGVVGWYEYDVKSDAICQYKEDWERNRLGRGDKWITSRDFFYNTLLLRGDAK